MSELSRPFTIAAIIAGLAICVPSIASAADSQKIGVVDVQRAIFAVPAGKAAKRKLQNMIKAKQKDLKKRENELKKMKTNLEKQAALLVDSVKRKKYREYQQKLLELQQAYVENQRKVKQREKKLFAPILKKLEKTINKVAKANGFVLILDRALYAAPSVDLTNIVIRQYGK
jgi:outer membrane protein